MFDEEMFSETARLVRAGKKPESIAKSLLRKYPAYTRDELRILVANVPSPDVRRSARTPHVMLMGLVTVSIGASIILILQAETNLVRIVAGLFVLFRIAVLVQLARWRRNGGILVAYAGARGLLSILEPSEHTPPVEIIDILASVGAIALAVWWIAAAFPALNWRGELK